MPVTFPLNPEAAAKAAARMGWEADAWRRSVARCPECQAARRGGGDRAEKKDTSMGEKTGSGPSIPAKEALRDPTQQERLRIRSVLDKHFDDDAGCWLDGYSDQKAGEECGVPWAMVTRIREAAYGPIRVDPELAALNAEAKRLGDEQAKIAATLAKVADEIAAFRAQMGAYASKRQAAR